MSKYTTEFFGEKMGVSADFGQASDQVSVLDADGNWISSGKQVADYRHDPIAAMREQIRDLVQMGGDDPDEEKNADIDREAELADEADRREDEEEDLEKMRKETDLNTLNWLNDGHSLS